MFAERCIFQQQKILQMKSLMQRIWRTVWTSFGRLFVRPISFTEPAAVAKECFDCFFTMFHSKSHSKLDDWRCRLLSPQLFVETLRPNEFGQLCLDSSFSPGEKTFQSNQRCDPSLKRLQRRNAKCLSSEADQNDQSVRNLANSNHIDSPHRSEIRKDL